MVVVVLASVGLLVGGPQLAFASVVALVVWRRRKAGSDPASMRPVLLMLLVELRSGQSVLGALHAVSERFPAHRELEVAVRLASVSGLGTALDSSKGEVRILMAHLTRANASGGSAADAVRRMLDSDMAREKALRLARTRALPVRLMVPVALLVLPGVVLLAYGPLLVSLLEDLTLPLG